MATTGVCLQYLDNVRACKAWAYLGDSGTYSLTGYAVTNEDDQLSPASHHVAPVRDLAHDELEFCAHRYGCWGERGMTDVRTRHLDRIGAARV